MPNLLNKIKDTARGGSDHHDYDDRYAYTDEERARYGDYQQGNQGYGGSPTGIGAGDLNPKHDVRGSHTGFDESEYAYHKDGREYVAPRGTAVTSDAPRNYTDNRTGTPGERVVPRSAGDPLPTGQQGYTSDALPTHQAEARHVGNEPRHDSIVGKVAHGEGAHHKKDALPSGQPGYGVSFIQPAQTHGGLLHGIMHPMKIMHRCQHCGNDNDISHHFKKDAVYRVDH